MDVAAVRRPENGGFTHDQAAILAKVLHDEVTEQIATKQHVELVVADVLDRAGEIVPEHLRYFLGPRESCGGAIDASLAWVLKEAAWKALALGSDVAFTALQLSFDRGTRALQGVWVESTWLAARAHIVRFARPCRMVSAVVEITQEVQ